MRLEMQLRRRSVSMAAFRKATTPVGLLVVVILLFSIRYLWDINGLHAPARGSSEPSGAGGATACVEKTLQALQEARKLNGKYKAFVEVISEDVARTEASRLDAIPEAERGRMHCWLVAVKDNIETSTSKWGLKTAAGSAVLETLLSGPIERSAPAIERLEREGAIILGKTNMDDFALQYHSYSTRIGQTTNCHDTGRFPGGSSGGSAVAVSLGLVDIAIGTDTGGSIRIPSSIGGVNGLRPSLNSISTQGVIPLSHSRDTVGPICQKVHECATAFEVMNNLQKRCNLPSQPSKNVKIGIIKSLFPEELFTQLESATQVLVDDLGAQIIDVDSLSREKLMKQTKSASMYEFKQDLETYLRQRGATATLESLVEQTKELCESKAHEFACSEVVESMNKKIRSSGSTPSSVKAAWNGLQSDLKTVLAEHNLDAVVFPAFTALPTRLKLGKRQEFCPNNRLAAITGSASFVVFGGMIQSGSKSLPIGLELVGFDECRLLEAGAMFERARKSRQPSVRGPCRIANF